jgi:DNA-binding transcriptional LysR family regulator
LGLTPSALSKLVTRLEDRLGARLLQRTTRRLQLTAEGEAFYARARPILAAMDEAEAEVVQAGAARAACCACIAGSPSACTSWRRPSRCFSNATRGRARHHDQRPAAGRHGGRGRPGDPHRAARRVVDGGPAHLQPGAGDLRRARLPGAYGTPRTPDDLQQHNCLWITSLPALRRWPFDTNDGIRVVHIDGNVVANNAETVLQLAVAGVGITRLTDVIVGDAIHRGELVPILADWHHVEPVPLFATYPERAQPVAQGAGDGGFPGCRVRQRALAPGACLNSG